MKTIGMIPQTLVAGMLLLGLGLGFNSTAISADSISMTSAADLPLPPAPPSHVFDLNKPLPAVASANPADSSPSADDPTGPTEPASTFASRVPVPASGKAELVSPSSSSSSSSSTVPAKEAVPLRSPGEMATQGGKMELQAVDPKTGEVTNIDVSSNNLMYNAQTGVYTISGDSYIIIPQRQMEILADSVTYNPKTTDMVAVGHVFVITKDRVISSANAKVDLNKDVSNYYQAKTLTSDYRIEAQEAQRTEQYIILHNGRFILESSVISKMGSLARNRGLAFGLGAIFTRFSASINDPEYGFAINNLAVSQQQSLYNIDNTVLQNGSTSKLQTKIIDKPISPVDVSRASFARAPDTKLVFQVRKVNIYRSADGFDIIELHHVGIHYPDANVAGSQLLRFGYNENNNFSTNLSPALGYDVDYGGFYYGPTYYKKLFNGWVSVSPIVSYGGGARILPNEGQIAEVKAQPGLGILAHYRSPGNKTDFGYSSTVREPIFMSLQDIGSPTNQVRVSAGQYYANGFISLERPLFITQVQHLQNFSLGNSIFFLRTQTDVGVAKDNFFPTQQANFFVAPKSAQPITTARFESHSQILPKQPLLYLGKIGSAGLLAENRFAAYGTGDATDILLGGPYVTLITGPILSQVTYTYAQSVGHTPFVFDSYYNGRNSVNTVNSLDLGKFFTIGSSFTFNIDRDNALHDLLVNKIVFFSLGHRAVRFALAYDLIQKRSYFGFTVNPEGGQVLMDFNTLNSFQPGYDPGRHEPKIQVVAPPPNTGQSGGFFKSLTHPFHPHSTVEPPVPQTTS